MALVGVALVIRFGFPAQDQYVVPLAVAGLVCVLLYTLGQWREIVHVFSRRQAKYGALATSSVLIALGILVAVNYIGQRQNRRWDLTAAGQYSLSDQTRNVLAQLDSPMQIMVFAQQTSFDTYRDRLAEYEYGSSQIETEYIDPDRAPTVAQQNNVEQYGTVIVSYKGRSERTTENTEQDITNTIIKVVTGEEKKLYFTQGHGEKDLTSGERDGYNAISEALQRENYGVEPLVIAQTGSVPDDASSVVAAGPQTDFLPGEIDALTTYLASTGKLLLLLDPPASADANQTPNLVALAREWGIDVQDNIVLDASGVGRLIGTDASVPVAASYPSHPITERFSILTAYPLARAVVPIEGGVDGRLAQTFIDSSPRSWAESNIGALFQGDESPELQVEQGDVPGPVSMAASVAVPRADEEKPTDTGTETEAEDASAEDDAPTPETRLAVVGDSDFATNGVLGIQGNRDMFMNVIGWLVQQENLISIRPRQADDRRITITASQQSNVIWLSLLLIPGAVFGTGVYTWWRRR
jgi:ABC-type uncharacterized transport system involved in gliding motility auxiliary subunit